MINSYISDYLVPKNLSLEFKNRMENLCSLSGTPMSPDLRQWVIQTFGLEMVRVIEGYSSLTAPVISPELNEKINRIVPNNYQGEDVNLMFKQKFDVSCCDNFRYAIIEASSGTTPDFTGWTINGLQFDTNYIAEFAADGCATNDPWTNLASPFDPHQIIAWYYGDGSNDPVVNILNDLSDPVTLTWKTLCYKTCYEAIIPSTDTVIPLINFFGPENFINVTPNRTFSTLDVSNPLHIQSLENYLKLCCGSSSYVTSTLVGSDYVVQIKDVYVAAAPVWDSSTHGTIFFNEIIC